MFLRAFAEQPHSFSGSVEGQRATDAVVTRLFFTVALLGWAVVTLLVVGQYGSFLPPWRPAMISLPIGIGLTIALSFWMSHHGWLRLGITLVLLSGATAITLIPLATGLGLRSMMLAFDSPLIIIAGVMLGAGGAVAFGALSLAALFAIAQLMRDMPAGVTTTADLMLVTGCVVGLSTVLGVLMSIALVKSLRAAKQQEHRFRQLLSIAADVYWEQDAQLRYTAITGTSEEPGATPPPSVAAMIGKRRWETSMFEAVPEQWELHKVELQKHHSIRSFVMRRRDPDGGMPGFISISGEPIFGERGEFQGYWGIGRVVTDEVESRARLEASELLYRELFTRASTGFVFHRGGRVLRANPAAATLFGYGTPEAMVGLDVFAHIAPSHRELSRQRFGALAAGPIGGSVPAVDLPMVRRDGTPVEVMAAMVRIAMADGPAELSIVTDMTQHKETQRALSIAKDQAEAASRTKSRFLANMSHEIRTPLNGVYGLAQLALREGLPAGRRHEYLRQIVNSAEHLTGLLSDVLDLSKIEAGELTLENIGFDLRDMLETIATSYRELAVEKGVGLRLDVDARLPRWVRGDPTRTRQIVVNYVSNAIKFTSGGNITLRAAPADGERIRIAVHDTGVGIDPATLGRLFMPFMQGDDSTTRRYGGTGLGLSICRELAVLLGGDVGVESVPGAGSSFWVELPLPASPAQPGGGADPEQSLANVRLLVVEDNDVNMMIAMAMLGGWGAQVTPAGNGRQAIEIFEAEGGQFDAVLMDVHMPVMDGLAATVELRKRHSADDLPIIAMTAAVLEHDRRDALAAGMNDLVSKPFASAQLLATVARWTIDRRQSSGEPAQAPAPTPR